MNDLCNIYMCIDRNSKLITLFLLTEFKLTTNGEVGQHGQHATRAVAEATGPVKDIVIFPFQIMTEKHALELAKTVTPAINTPVQVRDFPVLFFTRTSFAVSICLNEI